MKTCIINGCDKEATKRGSTCGPDHAQMLRCGVDSVESTEQDIESQDLKDDSWSISLNSYRIRTLEDLVSFYKIDLRVWSVDRFTSNAVERKSKNVDSQSYQVRVWLKKKKDLAQAVLELESIKDEYKNYFPKPSIIVRESGVSGNLLELIIPDIHFGKLAWHGETAFTDYDTDIAIKYYNDAFDGLVSRTSGFKFDKIALVIGNDMFHVDNRANTTTAGTKVDTDSRYHKIFKVVRKLIYDKIQSLRLIAPVDVIVVPGNHDELTAWHLGHSLECCFMNYTDVVVFNEPTVKKYYQFGKCMLMWAHGDKGSVAKYPLKMAVEQPQMFAETIYREIHVGHLHTEKVDEYDGIKVRVIPSLCATDYWHASMGFTNNQKCAQAFVWNKDEGLISTAMYTIKD